MKYILTEKQLRYIRNGSNLLDFIGGNMMIRNLRGQWSEIPELKECCENEDQQDLMPWDPKFKGPSRTTRIENEIEILKQDFHDLTVAFEQHNELVFKNKEKINKLKKYYEQKKN